MPRKRLTIIVSISVLLFVFGVKAKAQEEDKPFKIHPGTGVTYLNGGKYGNNDSISVVQFDSLLSFPLVVKDTSGQVLPVQSFGFIYMCRGVFADSTGRPVILTTPMYSISENGTLPEPWRQALIPQVKAGDTAIFTDIRYFGVKAAHAKLLYGKTIRIILTQ